MKKILALVLSTTIILSACGNEKPPQQAQSGNVDELFARISQLEEENRSLKAQLEEAGNTPTNEPVEETQPSEESQDESQIEVAEEPETESEDPVVGTVQTVQSQPGNTQQANYFELRSDNGIYKQIGDAFTVKSQYDDDTILVIPINFTNLKEDASDPWMTFVFDYTAYQEDDTQEYTLNGGQGAAPEEYSNDPFLNIKKDKSIDYYLLYTLELPGQDLIIKEPWSKEIQTTFKFQ